MREYLAVSHITKHMGPESRGGSGVALRTIIFNNSLQAILLLLLITLSSAGLEVLVPKEEIFPQGKQQWFTKTGR